MKAVPELIRWVVTEQLGAIPVERAALGSCDLSVIHIGGEWRWLVRLDGHDVAEGTALTAQDAREQAESIALCFEAAA